MSILGITQFWDFHGGNAGSNPAGDANSSNHLQSQFQNYRLRESRCSKLFEASNARLHVNAIRLIIPEKSAIAGCPLQVGLPA